MHAVPNHAELDKVPSLLTIPRFVAHLPMLLTIQVGQMGGSRNNVVSGTYEGMNGLRMDGWRIWNNLFYGVEGTCLTGGGSRGTFNHADLRNNIFYLCGIGSTSSGWYNNQTNDAYGFDFADHNYVAGTNGQAKIVPPPDAITRWGSWGTEQTGGTNGGLPGFTDVAVYDYRLAADSQLLGVGADLSANFTTDFFGQPRAVWSIGPFQAADYTYVPPEPPEPPAEGGSWSVGNIHVDTLTIGP